MIPFHLSGSCPLPPRYVPEHQPPARVDNVIGPVALQPCSQALSLVLSCICCMILEDEDLLKL